MVRRIFGLVSMASARISLGENMTSPESGKCCYGGCGAKASSCQSGWCAESASHCTANCNGVWCPTPGPTPAPPEPSPSPPSPTPSAPVELNWGKAFPSSDVSSWPAVHVPYGCGTDANMPSIDVLGKTLHFTVDLSSAGCRNVLAFQAVDAKRNNGCYCDGNSLSARSDDPYYPGNCTGPLNQQHQPCVELDFMEANKYVWATTIHAGNVPGGWQSGDAGGRGATRSGIAAWQYGPGSSVIDTDHAFDVSIGFPEGQGLKVSLKQNGNGVSFNVGAGADMSQVTEALKRGVTPGFSYWNSPDGMSWYDLNDCHKFAGNGGVATYSQWSVSDGVSSDHLVGVNVSLVVV